MMAQSSLDQIAQATTILRDCFTLSQLVPVYDSLLKITSKKNEEQQESATALPTAVVRPNKVQNNIHNEQQPSALQLLRVQWRLFHSNGTPWTKLVSIVLPFCAEIKNNNESSLDGHLLLEAVLNALFGSSSSTAMITTDNNDLSDKDIIALQQALTILTNADDDVVMWGSSCRILARIASLLALPLMTLTTTATTSATLTSTSSREMVISAIRTKLTQVFTRPLLEDLPILVDTLLPLYVPNKNRDDDLWTTMKIHSKSKLIHCTTILCCIPLCGLLSSSSSSAPPEWLWEMIYDCLRSSDRLLRRRGIYILNHMVNEGSQWKEYANCFEALEMESETHLLQPVWDGLEKLSGIPDPWMQVLYTASLDYTQANSRKTNLHRFLILQSLPNVTVDFCTESLIPAVDSMVASGSIGIMLNVESSSFKKTVQRTTLLDLMCNFLNRLLEKHSDWSEFMMTFWKANLLEKTREAVNLSLIWKDATTIICSESLLNAVLDGRKPSIMHRRVRDNMLKCLASMLAHAKETTAPPKLVLQTLALFLMETKLPEPVVKEKLALWLVNYQASVVATAFVDGQLLGGTISTDQDVRSGYITPTEVNLAPAVALACRLTEQPLWPAIAKGMGNVLRTERMARAILLMEHGCRFECISGMGNGALLMDRHDAMMPPPPNVESLLLAGVAFIESTIAKLLDVSEAGQTASRSGEVQARSLTYCRMLAHLEAICKGFPNSTNLDAALEGIVRSNRTLSTGRQLALVFAAVSCGTTVDKPMELIRSLLTTSYPAKASNSVRSILVLAKWGSLSHLVSLIDVSDPDVKSLLNTFVDEALDAVDSAPRNTIMLLFRCLLASGRAQLNLQDKYSASLISKISQAVFNLLEDTTKIGDQIIMIDEFCQLLFQPSYLVAECKKIEKKNKAKAPVRDAFRQMIKMAGSNRPHISRVVLSRACACWLRPHPEGIGLAAIPYREDIVRLLLQKEATLDDEFEENAGISILRPESDDFGICRGTTSGVLSRSILIVFLSRLPDVENGLTEKVLKELLHFILLKNLEVAVKRPSGGLSFVQLGSEDFISRLRSLETMCILSRFVTADIVENVCKRSFEAFAPHNSHHALRYFAEIFCIQCARKFPVLFGTTLVQAMRRSINSNQTIASLMIVAGNLVIGRYRADFMQSSSIDVVLLLQVAIPWLSSTQSFTRGIAQLLAHHLLAKLNEENPEWLKSSVFLQDIYRFLNEQHDMIRLRAKQATFFEEYDADSVCTAEGLFAIPTDENGDSTPAQMAYVLKDLFKELYDDIGDDENAPVWKRIEMSRESETDVQKSVTTASTDNFQRKIIPMDALNLLLEDEKTQTIRNKAGRRKQDLIVCASLIDKVPNLGGLARTAEIFAAQKLVIPDLSITKMDNFTSISVGAGDWIDIEECKEKDLLVWLRARRKEGYVIIGIEQTSSSCSLSTYEFPCQPTVILLGKEKEGIPVQLLHMVDTCVEIPQLGIIRSLNVHVSGAIAIWEFTKQRLSSQCSTN